MKEALIVIEIVISLLLIFILYLQSGKVKNVGSAIIGTRDVELFENIKRRGFEKFLHISTLIMISLFIFIPIIYLII